MKKLLLFSCLVISFSTSAQHKFSLVGTWRLVEFANLDSASGQWVYPHGRYPKGYFTYTRTGIVSINISHENPLIISEQVGKNHKMSVVEFLDNALGYFGTYTVDQQKSIVTHHVKGGTIPWYIDTDQPRPFIVKGTDTIIIGDNKTWKRILVKED